MAPNLVPRVCRPRKRGYAHPVWSFARQGIAFLVLVGLTVTTIPLASARSLIRMARNSALREESSTAAREASRALLQGNSQTRGMPPLPINPPGVTPGRPLTKAEKENKVNKLQLNPHDEVTLQLGQQTIFSAVPLDQDGNAIHGLKAQWESTDPSVLSITPEGDAFAAKVGSAVVTSTLVNKKEKVKVNVGPRKRSSGSIVIQPGEPFAKSASLAMQEATKSSQGTARTRRTRRASLRSHVSSPAFAPPLISDDALASRYYASNAVGTPPGKTTPGAATPGAATASTETPGSSNFSFSLPLVNLPGRNLDVDLNLIYNSRLWNKYTTRSNNQTVNVMDYNVVGDWPAPGFRLGFGSWISNENADGVPTSGTLIDADGTRHEMRDTTPAHPSCVYNSTDGTFIHAVDTGCLESPTVTYPDGTQARFDYGGFPTKITDRNGNYILISYYQGLVGLISTIQDTLGRFVRFNYDSSYRLVSITAPPFNGQGPDREVARFYYRDLFLPTGLFQANYTSQTVSVISDIYLTNGVESGDAHIGYHYDYSAYGMIYQVQQWRVDPLAPSVFPFSNSNGKLASTTTYNYLINPSNLSDAPAYTRRTDDWAGRTTGMPFTGEAPYYMFSVDQANGISTVTAPDGTVSETHAIVHQGFPDDGLITDSIMKVGATELSHTFLQWDSNATYPRVSSTKTTNESGQTKAVVYDQYDAYNNAGRVSERDFTTDGSVSPTELRRTETGYKNDSGYLSRGLIHVPTSVKIFAGGAAQPGARTDYAYDETTPVSYPELDSNMMYSDPGVMERGNVTSVTSYAKAADGTGATTHTTTYDIAGNALTAQVDCCQQKRFSYSLDYFYAYPIQVTSGNGPTLTTSATYDYNTGLVGTTRDENLQSTIFHYHTDSLRLHWIDYPDGGQVTYAYDGRLWLYSDAANRQHTRLVSSTKLNTTGQTVDRNEYFDGRGAVTQTFDNYSSANGWSTQDIEYDSMGRAYRTSSPYYCLGYAQCAINPTGLWTTQTFDNLGRVQRVDMPSGDDSNPTSTYVTTGYAGIFTTVTDQAGKQRRQKTDALGRVVRLDEPDANDLGSTDNPKQYTTYEYDVLDNLIHIAQGGTPTQSPLQHRYFKYDSLSRLTYERQVEQDAPWATGDSVAGNSQWSRKIIYNSSGLVQDAYDARKVKTHFLYDGLNRVKEIHYYQDGSDEPTTHDASTPDAFYYYDYQPLPNGAPSYDHGSANGRLIAMTYGSSGSITGNYFGYDNMGRVKQQRQVTGSNPYAMSYEYNLAGLLTKENYPTGRSLTYAYDEAGRLSSVSEGTKTYASGFTYEAHGGLSAETFGNGMVHSLSYNRALQPSEIKLRQSAGGAELQRYNYSYGEANQSNGSIDTTKNNGQLGRVEGYVGGAKQWEQRLNYDPLSRLSAAAEYRGDNSQQSWQVNYDYDRFGNKRQSANGALGLPSIATTDYDPANNNRFAPSVASYDPAGNILTDAKFRNLKYDYDANGRQTAVKLLNDTNIQNAVYDCAGQRVQTSANGATRQMVYDIFGQNIADYANGSLERENIYRNGQLLITADAAQQATPTPTPPGNLNGYSYRRTITIDHNKVPSDQSNFPVLISGTYPYLATAAANPSDGKLQNANGYDVIFTRDYQCSSDSNNKLSHEVEKYVAVTGEVAYWVKAPTVSHTVPDTQFYLCYGNSSITADQSNPPGVWDSNYKGVWHLPNGSTLSAADSTNQLNGTNHGAGAVTGKVDGGGSFDGASFVDHASAASLNPSSGITFSAWVKRSRTGTREIFAGKGDGNTAATTAYWLEFWSDDHVRFMIFDANGVGHWLVANATISDTTNWHLVVGTWDGLTQRIYIDGQADAATLSWSGTMNTVDGQPFAIGKLGSLGWGQLLGSLDDVRLANTARTADWITTEYNNQNSPCTFYSISDANSGGGNNSGGNMNGYSYRRTITIDHNKVPSDQSNFPVLISGTYPYLATAAANPSDGKLQNANGWDVIFTSNSECSSSNKLSYEAEKYVAATGEVAYWVKAPTVSHTVPDTQFYLCYGNSSIMTDQSDQTGVWDSNYRGVWHLPNGSTLSVADSTNQLNGTNHGAGAATGKVDGAAGFNGSSQYASMGNSGLSSGITLEAWVYRTGFNGFDIFADFGWNSTDGFVALVAGGPTHAFVKHAVAYINSGVPSALNTWEHVVWTVDSDNKPRLYINGALAFTSADSQPLVGQTHGGSLGSRLDSSGNPFQYFPGNLDEVRLSSTVRTADWIAAEYNNQNSPCTFYSISEASSSGSSAPVVHYVLTDLQGSVRAVMNDNGVGTSTVIARHDYLPFGEEIPSGIGMRTSAQGYGVTDTNRWKYGMLERDSTTGLDHTWWRKYENMAGRWTSPDPLRGSIGDPQSFNAYSYAGNDPVNFIDPTGLFRVCFVDYFYQHYEGTAKNGDPIIGTRITLSVTCIDFRSPLILNREPRPQNPKDPDTKTVNAALGVCSTAASVGQYSNVNAAGTAWRGGLNSQWSRIGWGGNQYTGARSAAVARAGAFSVLGKAMGVVGAGLNLFQGYQSLRQGNNAAATKSGVDATMGIVGSFGGPYGAAAAGVYFGVDMTVGWPAVGRSLALKDCGANCQYRLRTCSLANK